MNLRIDLNADLGEGAGQDDELLRLVSSANISCGLHAGNPSMLRASILAALDCGVAIGAHPSFDDRENFGRREMKLSAQEIFALVVYQLGAFCAVASSLGARVQHVKPHGALYNMAAREPEMAEAIVRAIATIDSGLILFAPGSSALARAAESNELKLAAEVFADRNYLADGSLVPRDHPQALLHDPVEAAARVVRMLAERKVRAIDGSEVSIQAETICVHSDTPGAVKFARELRECLRRNGVIVSVPKVNERVHTAIALGAPRAGAADVLPRVSPSGPEAGRLQQGRSKRDKVQRTQLQRVPIRPSRHLAHLPSFRNHPIVYFTVCTHRRRKILASDDCHQILRGLWERAAEMDGWWVGHYILMPDHLHLFARAAVDARPLHKWVGMWKNVSARRIGRVLEINPPIWQAEYFDRYLRDNESYSEKWNYVERNAVRAGLVEREGDWRWRGVIHDLRF